MVTKVDVTLMFKQSVTHFAIARGDIVFLFVTTVIFVLTPRMCFRSSLFKENHNIKKYLIGTIK